MQLADYYAPDRRGLSFELFPPKTAEAEAELYRQVDSLAAFGPDYLTCTYGAGGSTRDKTLDVLREVARRTQRPVASHLTCVGGTIDDLRAYLSRAAEQGVNFIVALRGDPPKGAERFEAVAGGLRYANELVALLRAEFPQFGVAVAGYPETHQEAPSPDDDLTNLKRKVDAGADVVITQLFYDNADFFRFRDRCEAVGIDVPIVPGILPVTNFRQITRITSMCGAKLPRRFAAELEAAAAEDALDIGIQQASDQVAELIAAGAPGLHFYVLNRSQATSAVLTNVGWPPKAT